MYNKHNVVIEELHRAKRIVSSFDKEKWRVREKYQNAGFPSNFANEATHNFKKKTEEITIPEWLFEERKIFTVRLPYAFANETFSMLFVNKIEDYTNGKAALSLKFGHCYFLRDFFDALCSNY